MLIERLLIALPSLLALVAAGAVAGLLPRLRPVAGWRRLGGALLGAFALWLCLPAFGPIGSGEELPCLEYEEARALAMEREVPLLVDFTADWCTACHRLKATVLDHPRTLAAADEFVCALVDVTRASERDEELQARYEVRSLPRLAIRDAEGRYVPERSMVGMVTVDELLAAIRGERSAEDNPLQRGAFFALLLVFLAGLGASLTPCVYPMIPITVGLFASRGAKSRMEGFASAVVYVLGMATTYTLLGVAAGLFGGLFGSILQAPAVLAGFALLFGALAFASLGLVTFRIPSFAQSWMDRLGHASLFVMGAVVGIIAAPCVGPIVSAILLLVAESRDVLWGGLLMWTFAMGMGVLFLVLGTFSSLLQRLPRAGGWMEVTKVIFAAIFLALAFHYGGLAWPEFAGLRDEWVRWLVALSF